MYSKYFASRCITIGEYSIVIGLWYIAMDTHTCDAARVWGEPRAAKHTKSPPNEETGLPINQLFPQPNGGGGVRALRSSQAK